MTGMFCTAEKDRPKHFAGIIMFMSVLMVFLWGCQSASVEVEPNPELLENVPPELSVHDIATLSSLDQIDDFPLYTMVYDGDLALDGENAALQRYGEEPAWACSLFAAYGDQDEMLYGRNFDWDFSPALCNTSYPAGQISIYVNRDLITS